MKTNFADRVERFLIETAGVRGEWVRLQSQWQALIAHAHYPEGVRNLLGEAVAAATLLADIIKIQGRLTLQIKGEGALQLLVVQVNDRGQLRGTAKWSEDFDPNTSALQQIESAHMLVAINNEQSGVDYQGVVDLAGCETLQAALENYFQTSEQLPTRLWLQADAEHAAGMLLQRLPEDKQHSEEDWQRVTHLAATISAEELRSLAAEELLYRLFHEERVQVFAPKAIAFQCNCSQDRTEKMVLGLGLEDALALAQEQGQVQVKCEFCFREYVFAEREIRALFNQPGVVAGNQTRH